jgi:hypothetical protein
VACARILAIPYWRIGRRDLVRLAERAEKSKGKSLWEEFEAWAGEKKGLPGAPSEDSRAGELVEFIFSMRARAKKTTAQELLAELTAATGIAPLRAIRTISIASRHLWRNGRRKATDGRCMIS